MESDIEGKKEKRDYRKRNAEKMRDMGKKRVMGEKGGENRGMFSERRQTQLIKGNKRLSVFEGL